MRTVFLASMVGVTLAWLAVDGLAIGPTNRPPAALQDTSALYQGERPCQAGRVEVTVELLPRLRTWTGPQSALATAWVWVDGVPHSQTAAAKIRANSSKFRPRLPAKVGELEVFVGLGQGCDWISAQRVR